MLPAALHSGAGLLPVFRSHSDARRHEPQELPQTLRPGRQSGGRPVAVLVYKRRQHLIDVFIWPGSGPRDDAYSRDGFNVERSSAEGMRISLVSDLNRNELSDLARLLIARR